MQYEVEIKCFVDTHADVAALVERMKQLDTACVHKARNELRNHYFNCDDPKQLTGVGKRVLSELPARQLAELIEQSATISVRTRRKNRQVFLIAKGVAAGGDAIHGSNRMEFESEVDMSITELDNLLVGAGLEVLAKWSGYKDVYALSGSTIEIQFSAGYGYMVEIEQVVDTERQVAEAEANIRELAKQLGLKEVDSELIGKMYHYYNDHWAEYYETDKTGIKQLVRGKQ